MLIVNDLSNRQHIAETNYWDSELARAGLLLISVNAGALRILLPPAHDEWLREITLVRECVLSIGPWPAKGKPKGYEFMWDDGSPRPFAITVGPDSFCEMLPAEPPLGQQWTVSVWIEQDGSPRKVSEQPCHYRRVETIPCLKPYEPESDTGGLAETFPITPTIQ